MKHSSNKGGGDGATRSSSGVYPNGRTSLDLASRLPCLPNDSRSYCGVRHSATGQKGEGGAGDSCSIMEDSPSTITPPTQPSEAMYLMQEWGGKSGAEGGGKATISPTSVAAFPPVEQGPSDTDTCACTPSSSNNNSGATSMFFAEEERGEEAGLKSAVRKEQQLQQSQHASLKSSTDQISSISQPLVEGGSTGSALSTKKKKKADDLLARVKKSRFASSMFSKKKYGSGANSSSNMRSGGAHGTNTGERRVKKKISDGITASTSSASVKPAARATTTAERSTRNSKSGASEPSSIRNAKKTTSDIVPDALEERSVSMEECQQVESQSPTPRRSNSSIQTDLERSIAGGHSPTTSEESIEVLRKSATLDDVLFSTSSGINCGQGQDNGVMITRVRSLRRRQKPEIGSSSNSSGKNNTGDDATCTTSILARPQNVKNRASSSGSQTKTQRRVQEVLSSITFDVPLGKADAERRVAERPWGSSENLIERSRSNMELVTPINAFGRPADGSLNDSLATEGDDSTSAALTIHTFNEHSLGLQDYRDDDDELFYDSDPGVVPVRRQSNQCTAEEGCTLDSCRADRPKIRESEEDGVHLLSMDNSFDDESSFDAMFNLREDEVVRNVVEDARSRRMELIWHPSVKVSDQACFDGHTAPLRCTAWIDMPTPSDQSQSKPDPPRLRWNPSDPHSVVSRKRLQASKNAPYSIDLTEVIKIEPAHHIDRAQHPFGRSQESFFVQTKTDVFLFQAPSDADRDRNIRSIQLIVARHESKRRPTSAMKQSASMRDSLKVTTIEDDGIRCQDIFMPMPPHHSDLCGNSSGTHGDIELVLPCGEDNLTNVFTLQEEAFRSREY
mmetsp:Transcript_25086/g.54706  ORF Transcript_25086/g.54706 Transcript_25086/m.54706 type:complete len:848 (+) Transcript_25086:57-2600(+)